MSYTLTYDEKVKGWTSFFSFIPEAMANLNGDFYSFKDGQLYEHNQLSGNRNTFYGQSPANTEIELIASKGASEIKMFKTINLESNSKLWEAVLSTDLDSGHIKKESFITKEGRHYAHIRGNASNKLDTSKLTLQGVGKVYSVVGSEIKFNSVPSRVRVGDSLYYSDGSTNTEIGTIVSIAEDVVDSKIKVTVASVLNTPPVGAFSFSAKNPIAESSGIKGYYASIRLSNQESGAIELFAVNSEIFKSFP